MGIFVEKVVFYCPGIIDAQAIGKLNLLDGFLNQLVFGIVVPRFR